MSEQKPARGSGDSSRLEAAVARARRERETRENDYRARSLAIHPWVCGRCGKEFDRSNLQLLTVHHKDHNHDNNPPDGSNWENLCVYCHENEHARYEDHLAGGGGAADGGGSGGSSATHRPLAGLADLLKRS